MNKTGWRYRLSETINASGAGFIRTARSIGRIVVAFLKRTRFAGESRRLVFVKIRGVIGPARRAVAILALALRAYGRRGFMMSPFATPSPMEGGPNWSTQCLTNLNATSEQRSAMLSRPLAG